MNDVWKIGAILIAILLITCGAVGYGMAIGMFKGEKGETGTSGTNGINGKTPVKGVDYFDGRDGKDAPINEPPTIILVSQSGDFVAYVPTILNCCKYTYMISVNVADMDSSTIKVTFYHSWNETGPWTENAIFFGGNGTYSSTAEFKYNYIFRKAKTCFWIIEAWDGKDISTKTFSYTITP